MGFHHRGNVNVQHSKICKNLIFTLNPSQTWVIPCQICMIFLDPLKKCYFCILSSKLGPLWCLSAKFGQPCPFWRPSLALGKNGQDKSSKAFGWLKMMKYDQSLFPSEKNLQCQNWDFWPAQSHWWTKTNLRPQKQSASEEKIKFCLKWSKRVQMGPKLSKTCYVDHLGPCPFRPLLDISMPAMFGHFWSQKGLFGPLRAHDFFLSYLYFDRGELGSLHEWYDNKEQVVSSIGV